MLDIPVVVDVDRAFKEAAKRVPQAIAPMQKAVDENTLEVIVEINKKGDVAEVFDFIGKSKKSMSELQYAIKSVRQQLDDLYQRTDGNVDLTQGEGKALSEALVILKDIAVQRQGLSKAIEKNVQDVQREVEAEREHQAAIKMVVSSVDDLNVKIAAWKQELNSSTIGGAKFAEAAKNAGLLERTLAGVNAQARIIGMNTGSIDQLDAKLQEINRKFNAMSKTERNERSKELLADYKAISKELEKEGKSLQQIVAEESRLQQLRQKGIQSRRYENAILNSTVKSVRVLQEQERILSDRLSRSRIGSSAYNKLKTDLEGVRAELSAVNGEAVQTESRLGRLIKNSLRLVALHAAATFVRNVREVTAEFELQRVALGSIIQDTERAEGLFRQIKAAAIQSPFEIKDLVSYTKQLSAYQIETDKLFDTTMKLADVSAGLGVDMGRLILAYGQVRAAAVLRGQELRQFTEAGIPLVDKLAEKFTELRGEMVSTGEVFQLISERAVPFRMIEEIFNDMTSAGGMFYKMQEKQAKTLAGQWANLKDSVSIMYDEIGNTEVVHSAMESMIAGARSVMQNWRLWANVIKVASYGLLSYVGVAKLVAVYNKAQAASAERAAAAESARALGMRKFVTALVGKTAAEKISRIGTDLHTAAMARAALATNVLSKAFWNLTAAMANNPFGIAIVAVGVLIALFTTLSNKTRDIGKDIDNAEASITSFNKTTKDTDKLIKEYEELSQKEALTAKEAAKLRDISRELGNIFPKTTEGINKQTGALTLNIEKLKEYNKEAETALRKGMQAQIRENEKTIKQNQKEINKLAKENTRGWGRNKAIGLLSPILFPLSDKRMADNTAAMIKLQDDNEQLQKTNKKLQDTLDGVTDSTNDASAATTKWQDKLIEFNSRIDKRGNTINVISPDQIKNYSKLSDALQDIAKKYKEYDEQEKAMKASIEGKAGAEREELQGILDRTTARKKLAKEELDYYNAFYLTQKKVGGRDNHLQQLRNEINDITNAYKKFIELKKYKSEAAALSDINTFFPGLKGWKPTFENMLKKLEGMLSTYSGDADATRLIQQAIANIKFDDLKKDLDDQLKRLSDEIKHSEEARNFYENILGLTGDRDLATNLTVSVYGEEGEEFADRIKKRLVDSLSALDAESFAGLDDKIRDAFDAGDYKYLMENLDKVPDKLRDVVKQVASDAEKYNGEVAKSYAKLLMQFDEIEQQRVNISQKAAQDVANIESGLQLELKALREKGATDAEQQAAKDRATLAKDAVDRAKKMDLSRLEADYRLFFSSVGVISMQAARRVAAAQKKMLSDQFVRGQISLSKYKRELKEIDEQLSKYSGVSQFEKLMSGDWGELLVEQFKNVSDGLRSLAATIKTENGILNPDADTLKFLKKVDGILNFGNFAGIFNGKKKASIVEEANKAARDAYRNAKVRGDSDLIANNKAAAAARDILDKYAEKMSETSDMLASMSNILIAVFTALEKVGGGIRDVFDQIDRSGQDVDLYFADFGAGLSDFFGAFLDLGKLDFASAFSRLANLMGDARYYNREIKRQQQIVSDLEHAYDRLGVALEKSFGSDYVANYNQQLVVLQSQVEAYKKQAEAERAKGKAADEETAKGYDEAARKIEEQIADAQAQLSEFMSGTNLTSAAQEFAQAWIEAYKEFGSTTDAMKEKFNDMIENMVVNSLAARLIQSILKPVFDAIDTASEDGALTAEDVANISKMVPERIAMINGSMSTLMNQLTAAGLNLRQMAGGFTGISRDIAGASEESINGLAAGINTQNFYMQHIDMNVAAILAALTGGTTTAQSGTTGEYVDPYKDAMLSYAVHIPDIHTTLLDILSELSSVITLNGTKRAVQVRMS